MKKNNSDKESRTGWRQIEQMPDEKINTSDVPELDEAFFRQAKIRMPAPRQWVSLRLDRDILDRFKNQGKGYQTKINAILRAHVQAHTR